MKTQPASRLLAACGLFAVMVLCPALHAQLSAIPEPPLMLLGTVTEASTNQPVAITSIVWQVTDGTQNKSISAVSLPATRVVDDSGQSFYVLEVPFEVRSVQTGGGPVALAASNGFDLNPASPTYTLTAIVNGQAATIRSVSGTAQPAGTTSYTFNDYTPDTQGRMLRVDLNLNEVPYLTWAAGYFPNPNAPEAAPGFNYDGDGFTNDLERLAGTDPTNGSSALRLANFSRSANGDTFSLTWASVPGKTYQIETSQSLLSVDWMPVGDPVTATATSSNTMVPLASADQRRFYRVKVLP